MLVLGAGLGCAHIAIAAEGREFPGFASRQLLDSMPRFATGPRAAVADARQVGGAADATEPAAVEAVPELPSSQAVSLAGQEPRATPPSWPTTLPEARAEANVDLATRWPDVDVELAKARCTALLHSIDAVTVPEPPMRQGACGAPAPVRLISVGRKPEIALSPPPLVTCDMVQALHSWLTKDVQPAARRILGSEVVTVELMSDYSCRNAYGSRRGRLSEHARANAIDIRGFLTAKGEMTAFLEDWGPTGREIREMVAKAAREKAAQAVAQGAAGPVVEQATVPATMAPGSASRIAADGRLPDAGAADHTSGEVLSASGITRATIADGFADVTSRALSSKGPPAVAAGFSHLGGPKQAAEPTAGKAPEPVNVNGRAAFLRFIHDSACRTFGTVLGPEANRAHRNHLHVDMADRSTGVFCE